MRKLYSMLFCAALTSVPLHASDNNIVVDAKNRLGKVNRNLFGQMLIGSDSQFIWSRDTPDMFQRQQGSGIWNDSAMQAETLPTRLLKEIRPGVIRYPGGCEVKSYDWKKMIGPLAERTKGYAFGLMEFLQVCEQTGAQPQIVMSSFAGTPEDQRDLVEFLNCPAIPEFPWAMKRAALGHPEPYKVKYFELCNEPEADNGRLKPHKQWTPEAYSQWALKTIELCKERDPSIKLGVHIYFGSYAPHWDAVVLPIVGAKADFIIVHTYGVNMRDKQLDTPQSIELAGQACVVASMRTQSQLQGWREIVKQRTGRDIPFGITEYNADIRVEKPSQFRKSMAAALFCADYLRFLLEPANDYVIIANYWHYINGYWGMISGKGKDFRVLAPYRMFHMWAQYFGDERVETNISSRKIEFPGFGRVAAARGDRKTMESIINKDNLLKPSDLMNRDFSKSNKASLSIEPQEDMGLKINIAGHEIPHYPNFSYYSFSRLPEHIRKELHSANLRLSFKAKWIPQGTQDVMLGLGMVDGRGWAKTRSASQCPGLEYADNEWREFSMDYTPLTDANAICMLLRFQPSRKAPVHGTLLIRELRLDVVRRGSDPAYDAITASSALSSDGQQLSVMLINRNTTASEKAVVVLKNFASASLRSWVLKSDNIYDTTVAEPLETRHQLDSASFETTLPPHSITALVFDRKPGAETR